MNIQSTNGVSTYLTMSKTNSQPAPAKSSTPLPSSSVASSGSTDQVTLSEAAQKLIADDLGTTQHRTHAQELYLQSAYSDPASARKLASDMALGNSTIFYDIRDTPGDQPVNKLSTGRVIDENFKKNFYVEASKIDAGRREIYNSETAKGTNPVEIIRKMIDFTNSQSKDYLEANALLDRPLE